MIQRISLRVAGFRPMWRAGVVAATSVCLALAASPAAAQHCPEGSTKVGEKRVPIAGGVRIHPICRKVRVDMPQGRGSPVTISAVEIFEGAAIVRPDGTPLEDAEIINTSLADGMALVTRRGGRARLVTADGTRITLGENTRLIYRDLRYQPAPKFPEFGLDFISGFMRWARHRAAEPARRQALRVGPVVVGTRGTDFAISYDSAGTGWLKMYEGAIDYRSGDKGTVRELRAGQTLRFVNGRIAGVE